MKYIITAINRLTGEREAISSPRSLNSVKKLKNKWLKQADNSKDLPWSDLKVERLKTNM